MGNKGSRIKESRYRFVPVVIILDTQVRSCHNSCFICCRRIHSPETWTLGSADAPDPRTTAVIHGVTCNWVSWRPRDAIRVTCVSYKSAGNDHHYHWPVFSKRINPLRVSSRTLRPIWISISSIFSYFTSAVVVFNYFSQQHGLKIGKYLIKYFI